MALKLSIKKGISVRNTVVLPHRFGAEKRILVFARGEKEQEAENAGAAYVGNAELVEKIKQGWLDFDVAVATPDMMREIGKLGPILGRRGLMPNPKTRTVTMDVAGAITELKKGRVEFRSDKTGVVHLPIGNVSMTAEQLVENLNTVVVEVKHQRPPDLKGDFLRSLAIASTMGPQPPSIAGGFYRCIVREPIDVSNNWLRNYRSASLMSAILSLPIIAD